MKRSSTISISEHPNNHKKKKMNNALLEQEQEQQPISDVLLDENLVYEIMKHVDAKTLGSASCVNKQWHRTSQDERLWEMICTQHWTNMSCGNNQLRSVVLALGGFRRLYAHYLWPLSRPSNVTAVASRSASTVAAAAGSNSSVWPCLPSQCTNSVPRPTTSVVTRWGKDEVQLSLSLLSIRFFEKMSYLPSKK